MHPRIQRQLSVALENQPGRLAAITRLIANAGVNIDAICVIDNVEQGMVRMVTSDPTVARSALEQEHLQVVEAEVLAVDLTDRLGKLAAISQALADGAINIEYAYATADQAGARTRMILKVSRPTRAHEILEALREE